MSERIAFAGTGDYIDQHFGSARYWQIYDIGDDGSYRHVESRRTAAKCQGSCEGGFEHLFETLKDCDALFVGKIGESAAAFMIGRGKRVFEATGPIDEIVAQISEEHLLEES